MKFKNRYFLIRHGESSINKKYISLCWPEKIYSPLTRKGEKQIKGATKELKNKNIDLIFSSDLLRTKQTAEIVGRELGVNPKFDKRLREINIGIFNGKPVPEVGSFYNRGKNLPPVEHYSKRFKISPPKGENYADIEKRMSGFIKEIDKKYKNKNILIVGHQRPFTLLEKAIYGYNMEKFVEIIMQKKEIKLGELRKICPVGNRNGFRGIRE